MSAAAIPAALSVKGLTKSYGSFTAVDGLDLEVQAGECFGLLGPNGAGKTTTVEICEGLTQPDSGEVEVLGRRWSMIIPAAIGLFVTPTYWLTTDASWIIPGFLVQSVFAGVMCCQMLSYLTERFPTEVRATAGAFSSSILPCRAEVRLLAAQRSRLREMCVPP